MGNLFIVATPLGNIEDITARAQNTLKNVDIILSEDTRVGHKLLSLLGITVPLLSYHQHSSEETTLKILNLLNQGKNIALITDAGTPGISDPGNELISALRQYSPELKVTPIPGPSAVTALLSICGFNCSQFVFLGFYPKKKRTATVQEIMLTQRVVVFFESPHRILKTLSELAAGGSEERDVVVGRELTKMYETIYRGTVKEVLEQLKSEKNLKGEIVVAVDRASKNSPS